MRPFFRSAFPAWSMLFVVLLFAPALFAGTVYVEDASDKLPQAAETSLLLKGPNLPFDALVIFTGKYANAADLDRYIGSRVDAPDKIVVGVDPDHRRTSVHFGKGVGVPSYQFKNVEQAGAPFFKRGDYGAGVEAILERAHEVRTSNKSAVTPTPAPAPTPSPAPMTSPAPAPAPASSSSAALGIFILVGIIGFVAIFFLVIGFVIWKAFQTARSASRGYDGQRPYGGGHSSGGNWGHHGQHNGVGSAVTHGAAALGGAAIGYAAGRHYSNSSNSSSDSSFNNNSWDSSSSSSSWDSSSSSSDSSSSSWDSSSSSSSYDAGGSTSDWSSSSSDSSSSGGGSTSDW